MSNSKNSKRGRKKKVQDPNLGPDELQKYTQDIGGELEEKNDTELKMNPTHLEFCNLYVNGGPGYAGKAGKCYMKAIGTQAKNKASEYGARLLKKEHIIAKIKELTEENEISIIGRKLMVEENLMKIMDECAKGSYKDKYGNPVSPAALRSVAVNASKALIDIWGLNKPTEVKITGENEKGIVFNIIQPGKEDKK